MALTARTILSTIQKKTDVGLGSFVVCIVLLIIVPLPPVIIDCLITLCIMMSVTILLVTLYTENPLYFSSLPSLLLFMTLYRLALNIATTRMILTDAYAGQIIQTFGNVVTGGTQIVGFVLFILLTGINFVVITKGSGRVAEVAARFTLDSMPGKQASIDADLSAGIINRDEAKILRQKTISEADFYGAMDGASKFVRGDAIAGIVITLVNIVGGVLVGTLVRHMSFHEIVKVYLTLTVGDGLVTQIPALLISVGAGIIVTRSSSRENLGRLFKNQIFNNPKVLIVTSAILLILALVPGMPTLVMFPISLTLFAYAYTQIRRDLLKKAQDKKRVTSLSHDIEKGEDSTKEVAKILHIDPIEVVMGVELTSLSESLKDTVGQMRAEIAGKLGVILPKVHIRLSKKLPPNTYVIKLKGNEVANGEIPMQSVYAFDLGVVKTPIESVQWIISPEGLPSAWIDRSFKDEAIIRGYSVLTAKEFLPKRFEDLLITHAHELLNRQIVSNIIQRARAEAPAVVDELIPHRLTIGQVGQVLKNLLKEGVSIRDIVTILDVLADHIGVTQDLDMLTEEVRQGLTRKITSDCLSSDGSVHAITLDSSLESLLEESIQEIGGKPRLALLPAQASHLKRNISAIYKSHTSGNSHPIVLTTVKVRPHLQKLIAQTLPKASVLSYSEILPDVQIEPIATLTKG